MWKFLPRKYFALLILVLALRIQWEYKGALIWQSNWSITNLPTFFPVLKHNLKELHSRQQKLHITQYLEFSLLKGLWIYIVFVLGTCYFRYARGHNLPKAMIGIYLSDGVIHMAHFLLLPCDRWTEGPLEFDVNYLFLYSVGIRLITWNIMT